MKLFNILQEVLKTKRLTPEVEQQINRLLWANDLDSQDMEALEQFIVTFSEKAL